MVKTPSSFIKALLLLQILAQLTLSFKIVFFFFNEFDMLNTSLKVLFDTNKYFSRYKHFCVLILLGTIQL